MTEANLPVRARWFRPDALQALLQTHFLAAETRYLVEPGSRSAPLVKLPPTLAFEAACLARFPLST